MTRKAFIILAIVLVAALALAACGGEEPTATPAPTATAVPTAMPAPTEPPAEEATAAPEAKATAEPEAEATAEPEAEATAEPAAEATAEPEAEATAEPAAEATAEPEAEAAAEPESAASAAASTFGVDAARQIRLIVNETDTPLAAVSPDGARLAWIQSNRTGLFRSVGQLCFFTFANAAKSCVDRLEGFNGFPYQLYWSADGASVAFTENPIQLGHESDIWVANAADGTVVNRTDDGLAGSWISAEQPSLDILPMWSATDGMIYFWRVVPQGEFQFTIGLYRVPPTEGDAELVRDLSDVFGSMVPTFDQNTLTMDSISALSPDGSTVAVALSDIGAETNLNLPARSIWLISVADPAAEPTQVMSSEDLQKGIPSFLAVPAVPVGLSWTADSAALVVGTFANNTHAPLMVYYHVDTANGASTPVVDFSGAESLDALFSTADNPIPLRFYSPWTASLAPDNLSLLMYSDLGGVGAVFQAMLPPDGSLPPSVASAQTPPLGGGVRSSRASDGKVVMFGVLFTMVPQ